MDDFGFTDGWIEQGGEEGGVIILPNGDPPNEYTEETTYQSYASEEEEIIQPVEEITYENFEGDILGISQTSEDYITSTVTGTEVASEDSIRSVDSNEEQKIVYRLLSTGGSDSIYSIDDIYPILKDIKQELIDINRHMVNQETFGFVTTGLLSMILGGIICYAFLRRIF